MHKLDDRTLITLTLLRRFQDEATHTDGDGRSYALILRGDGNLLVQRSGPQLAPDQLMFAADVLRRLNRDLHHDGAWVMVFTNPAPAVGLMAHAAPSHCDYDRYCIIFLDADGDPQFTLEWEKGITSDFRSFADVLIAGPLSLCERAEAAWQTWFDVMRRTLDPSDSQLLKAAKGQTRH